MPEKTLREKVERAREALKWIYDRPESHIRLDEALTALEARVEELEKENARLTKNLDICEDRRRVLVEKHDRYMNQKKEAPDGK